MSDKLPFGLEVVASEHIPPGRGFFVKYKGRQPECRSHVVGVTHAPCWSVTRLDFDPEESPDILDDEVTEEAHRAVRESCDRWRRSLLIDGPTSHLHSHECLRVAELLRARKPTP